MNIEELNKKLKQSKGNDLPLQIWHRFMKEYGWIPYEQAKELYIPLAEGLWKCIVKDREEEKRQMESAKLRRR